MGYRLQKWKFLGGRRQDTPSFVGPSFSTRPPIVLPPQTSPSLSLPSRPISKPPPTPPGLPPTTATPTTNQSKRSLRSTKHTSSTGSTKTRVQLLVKAKDHASQFLGKYWFGTIKKLIDVLPQNKTPPHSHRDDKFKQGKIPTEEHQRIPQGGYWQYHLLEYHRRYAQMIR